MLTDSGIECVLVICSRVYQTKQSNFKTTSRCHNSEYIKILANCLNLSLPSSLIDPKPHINLADYYSYFSWSHISYFQFRMVCPSNYLVSSFLFFFFLFVFGATSIFLCGLNIMSQMHPIKSCVHCLFWPYTRCVILLTTNGSVLLSSFLLSCQNNPAVSVWPSLSAFSFLLKHLRLILALLRHFTLESPLTLISIRSREVPLKRKTNSITPIHIDCL